MNYNINASSTKLKYQGVFTLSCRTSLAAIISTFFVAAFHHNFLCFQHCSLNDEKLLVQICTNPLT